MLITSSTHHLQILQSTELKEEAQLKTSANWGDDGVQELFTIQMIAIAVMLCHCFSSKIAHWDGNRPPLFPVQ